MKNENEYTILRHRLEDLTDEQWDALTDYLDEAMSHWFQTYYEDEYSD